MLFRSLFSWSALIIGTEQFRGMATKRESKHALKFSFYSLLALSLFMLSESSYLSFLPYVPNSLLALILIRLLIGLTFVEDAVKIRKLGKVFPLMYFSTSFPLFSILYFAFCGDESNLSQLLICQLAVVFINSLIARFFLRSAIIRG